MLNLEKAVPLPTISGSGFMLRPFRPGDEQSLQKHMNDERVARDVTHIPYPYTMEHANAWVNQMSPLAAPDSTRVDFVIDVAGEVAGSVAFINVDGHKAQVSMWVSPRYWRRGIATGALRLLVQFGFGELGLVRIYAYHYSENIKTRGVLEKVGFRFEGAHEKEWRKIHDGNVRLYDSNYYSIVRSDMQVRSVALSLATGIGYEHVSPLAAKLTALLSEHGIAVVSSEASRPDLAISLGGDGNMMHTVTKYSQMSVPTLGINAGRLGFLTASDADQLETVADRIAHGLFALERRMALGYRFRGQYHGPYANEVRLRHPDEGLMTVAVTVGEEIFFETLPADSVLIAAATGSTAYSLSAGGPILMPESTSVIINAICPPTLSFRPVVTEVLSRGGSISLRVIESKHGYPLGIRADSERNDDGPVVGEEIVIVRHPQPLLFATFGTASFRRALQTKLGLHA